MSKIIKLKNILIVLIVKIELLIYRYKFLD